MAAIKHKIREKLHNFFATVMFCWICIFTWNLFESEILHNTISNNLIQDITQILKPKVEGKKYQRNKKELLGLK